MGDGHEELRLPVLNDTSTIGEVACHQRVTGFTCLIVELLCPVLDFLHLRITFLIEFGIAFFIQYGHLFGLFIDNGGHLHSGLAVNRIIHDFSRSVDTVNTVTTSEIGILIILRHHVFRQRTFTQEVIPALKFLLRLRVFDFQLDVVEIDSVTILHGRQVECNRLELLTAAALGVVGTNGDRTQRVGLPFGRIAHVAKQLIEIVVTGFPVSLSL